MVSIFYKGKFTNVPAEWNELSGKQLVGIVKVLAGDYLPEVQRIRLLQVLMGWSWLKMAVSLGMMHFWELPKIDNTLRRLQLFGKVVDRTARMAVASEQLTAFIFDGNTLTKNPLLKYKHCYGPMDEMGNMRMAEFVWAEGYFLRWKESASTADLNMLVATLWRPRKRFWWRDRSGDKREPFNQATLNGHVQVVDKWPLAVKLAMATIYDGMRKHKIASNAMLFESNGKSEGDGGVYGMWSVMRSVAMAGHFGDFEKVENMYVDTVMMELTEAMIQAQKLEEQMDAQKDKL